MRSALVRYLLTAALGVAAAVALLVQNDVAGAPSAAERCRILADAFTIPGMLLVLFWLLAFLSHGGAFDTLAYAGRCLVRFFLPNTASDDQPVKYVDYILRRRETRKPLSGARPLLIVGAVFLVPAVVFTVLYYTV